MAPKVFALASGKGGVGKTVIAANMARVLSRGEGLRVLVVDGDFGLSSIDVLLDLKCDFTIDDFLFEGVPMEEIVCSSGKGFDLLPAASGTHEVRELSVEQMRRLTYSLEEVSKKYDAIIIDCPPGVTRDTLQLCSVAHRTILCGTPDPTSITDTYAFIKLMNENYREQSFTVLMNMVHSEEEGQRVFRRLLGVTSDFLGVSIEYAGALCHDSRIRDAVRARQLFVEKSPHSSATRALSEITRKVYGSQNHNLAWNGGLKALWPMFLTSGEAR